MVPLDQVLQGRRDLTVELAARELDHDPVDRSELVERVSHVGCLSSSPGAHVVGPT